VPPLSATVQADRDFGRAVATQVLENISAIVDKDLGLGEFEVQRLNRRSAGEGEVHISFRFKFVLDGNSKHGCLLIPLTQSVAAACSMLMMPMAQVPEICASGELATPLKDALLELGNMLASAMGSAYQEPFEKVAVTFAGCQGVRAGLRPALTYTEGSELLTVNAYSDFDPFGRFQFLLLLPPPWGPEGPPKS
jgi:hypothetical protein